MMRDLSLPEHVSLSFYKSDTMEICLMFDVYRTFIKKYKYDNRNKYDISYLK